MLSLALAATLFSAGFDGADGLVTNEYAYYNPDDRRAVWSDDWVLTSGSLFTRKGAGWTGVPDMRPVSKGTHSSVFRLVTRRMDFSDVAVDFLLYNEGLSATPQTPAEGWDGVHVWLRYHSEKELYYASINRRDNTVVIKKKVRGGQSNDGTYYNLSPYVPYQVPYHTWQAVRATAQDRHDGSVALALYLNGELLVSAVDKGTGAPPYRGPGKVGIRGDNAQFRFDDFSVSKLAPIGQPPGGQSR